MRDRNARSTYASFDWSGQKRTRSLRSQGKVSITPSVQYVVLILVWLRAESNDVAKHKKTSKDMVLIKESKVQTDVASYFQESTSLVNKVVRAETLFAQFVAEHNLPFSIADHYTQLAKQMFPDSQVAERFSCDCTKTTCIIKGALAPTVCEKVVLQCQLQPFSILVDESNDRTCEKEVAILVRVWDQETKRVATRFLHIMPVCNIPTAENIFATVEETLK